jgi:hypothetical protein
MPGSAPSETLFIVIKYKMKVTKRNRKNTVYLLSKINKGDAPEVSRTQKPKGTSRIRMHINKKTDRLTICPNSLCYPVSGPSEQTWVQTTDGKDAANDSAFFEAPLGKARGVRDGVVKKSFQGGGSRRS